MHKLGPKQRNILAAINGGQRLYQEGGRWYLYSTKRAYQNKERCMSLYTNGYLMSVDTQEGTQYAGGYRVRYDVTGKRG